MSRSFGKTYRFGRGHAKSFANSKRFTHKKERQRVKTALIHGDYAAAAVDLTKFLYLDFFDSWDLYRRPKIAENMDRRVLNAEWLFLFGELQESDVEFKKRFRK